VAKSEASQAPAGPPAAADAPAGQPDGKAEGPEKESSPLTPLADRSAAFLASLPAKALQHILAALAECWREDKNGDRPRWERHWQVYLEELARRGEAAPPLDDLSREQAAEATLRAAKAEARSQARRAREAAAVAAKAARAQAKADRAAARERKAREKAGKGPGDASAERGDAGAAEEAPGSDSVAPGGDGEAPVTSPPQPRWADL
jgi:hypothetical protein